MNNNIAIIEENGQSLAEKFGLVRIEYLQEVTDQKIDEWVRHIFSKHPDIEKIIIPVRLGKDDSDYTGLRVGLHIRLIKDLKEKRLIPIIFVSEQTKSEIIGNQVENNKEKTATLLFTPGVKLISSFDIQSTADTFGKTLSEQELKMQVLPKLLLTNQREQGHQLANEWGVFRLAKFAGKELTTIQQPKDLYFKYRFSLSDLGIDSQDKNKTNIQGNNDCNYLLIDDNALKGWEELLAHIIKSEIINKFTKKITSKALTTFEEADTYGDYESHDLIFLDLRLTKEEDNPKNPIPIGEYSGVKLLEKIKGINKGIQVIILTASNKAWNMKALLDAGADGYFIKESPEIPVSDDASKANYESLVKAIKEAFERRYLRDVFKEIKTLKGELDAKVKSKALQKSFAEELKKYLDLGFSSFASKEAQFSFDSAFTYFFLGLELISKELIDEDNPTEINGDFFHEFRRTGSKLRFFSNGSKTGNDLKSKSRRVNYDQKFYNLLDVAGISSINSVAFIGKRNDFFHPDTINRSQSVVIEKQDVMDAFKCLKELAHNL